MKAVPWIVYVGADLANGHVVRIPQLDAAVGRATEELAKTGVRQG